MFFWLIYLLKQYRYWYTPRIYQDSNLIFLHSKFYFHRALIPPKLPLKGDSAKTGKLRLLFDLNPLDLFLPRRENHKELTQIMEEMYAKGKPTEARYAAQRSAGHTRLMKHDEQDEAPITVRSLLRAELGKPRRSRKWHRSSRSGKTVPLHTGQNPCSERVASELAKHSVNRTEPRPMPRSPASSRSALPFPSHPFAVDRVLPPARDPALTARSESVSPMSLSRQFESTPNFNKRLANQRGRGFLSALSKTTPRVIQSILETPQSSLTPSITAATITNHEASRIRKFQLQQEGVKPVPNPIWLSTGHPPPISLQRPLTADLGPFLVVSASSGDNQLQESIFVKQSKGLNLSSPVGGNASKKIIISNSQDELLKDGQVCSAPPSGSHVALERRNGGSWGDETYLTQNEALRALRLAKNVPAIRGSVQGLMQNPSPSQLKQLRHLMNSELVLSESPTRGRRSGRKHAQQDQAPNDGSTLPGSATLSITPNQPLRLADSSPSTSLSRQSSFSRSFRASPVSSARSYTASSLLIDAPVVKPGSGTRERVTSSGRLAKGPAADFLQAKKLNQQLGAIASSY